LTTADFVATPFEIMARMHGKDDVAAAALRARGGESALAMASWQEEARRNFRPGMTPEERQAAYAREERRWQRKHTGEIVAAIEAGDDDRFVAALDAADAASLLPQAFRAIARLGSAPANIRECFLVQYLRFGDHMRQEAGSYLELIDALRVLLPPYEGGAVMLYRGDGFMNRKRRTYGLSWTADREVAESFAEGDWRLREGGSVLLQVDAPAAAIICAPHVLDDSYGETEYVVDRRRLRDVRVLRRYPSISFEEWEALQAEVRIGVPL
jgi:hypothetical protein